MSKRLFLIYLILMAPTLILAQGEKRSTSVLIRPQNDARIQDRKFEQVPAVGTSSNGKTVYVAWYSGGKAPGPGNFVTVAISKDGGRNWMQDQIVVYPDKPSERVFDPALWRDMAGQMHLFVGISGNNQLFDGWGGVHTMSISFNGTSVFAGPTYRLTDGIMSNKPLFIPESNQLLFPVYIDKLPDPAPGSPADGAFIKAQKFSAGTPISSVENYSSIAIPEHLRIHDEPQLVQLAGNEFLAMVRTVKGIFYTLSDDYGRSWSPVAPFTAAGPTTSSRFYIGKLRSGNLLLVFNNSTTRNNMTAALSTDGGKTWPHRLLLDSRDNVSYPDVDQSSDGTIHVVFDRDRTGAMEILYCNFKEEDIVNGTIAKIFRSRVNSSGKLKAK